MPNFKTAIFAAAFALPISAQAQTACEGYTVASGDTLRLIAEKAYGSRDLSTIIYNANRGVVGSNPNNIEIGMRLNLPCSVNSPGVSTVIVEDTSDQATVEETDALTVPAVTTLRVLPTIQPDVAETPEPVAPVDDAPLEPEVATLTPTIIKVPESNNPPEEQTTETASNPPVTGETPVVVETVTEVEVVPSVEPATSGETTASVEVETSASTNDQLDIPESPIFVSAGTFPPFSDGDGAGMMSEIVNAALFGAEYIGDVTYNAVSQPFDPLMASSDPDVILSFPWVNPGCEGAEFLSDRSKDLCANYQFSDTAYEIVMTFFVADRGGLAQASQPSDFAGKRICVPQQYPTSHLTETGFDSANVKIERGNSVAECMSKLLSGQTDVVNADYLSVESTYAVLNSQSIIVENPSFTWIRSVHAVANTSNEAAVQALADFDNGLRRIKESGEWLSIVTPYIE